MGFLTFLILVLLLERRLRPILRLLGVVRSRPLAVSFAIGCSLLAFIPAAWSVLFFSEIHAAGLINRSAVRIERSAIVVAREVGGNLTRHRAAIAVLADALGQSSELDPELVRRFHSNFPSCLTMLIADAKGTVIFRSGSGRTGANAPTQARMDVSDREYFKGAVATGAPFISNAFRGRGLGTDILVGISAPIAGERGVIQCSLAVADNSQRLGELELDARYEMLMLDAASRVVYAHPAWNATSLEDGFAVPMVSLVSALDATKVVGLEGQSPSHLAVAKPASHGRMILLRLPLTELRDQIWRELRWLVASLGIAGFLAFAIGFQYARRIAEPMVRLSRVLANLDPAQTIPDVRISSVAATEMRGIYLGFHRLSRRTRELVSRLDSTIVAREETITERTAELVERNAELVRLSRTDPLTGVSNRRAFDHELDSVWQTLRRVGRPVGMVIMDIDYFKAYNDQYGHPAGDAVLRSVASAISSVAQRSSDAVSRMGGEEFGILLAVTDLAGALRVAEDARQAIRSLAIPHQGSPAGIVTASFGIAVMVPGVDAMDPAELVAASDQALYRSKQAGRDRVSQ